MNVENIKEIQFKLNRGISLNASESCVLSEYITFNEVNKGWTALSNEQPKILDIVDIWQLADDMEDHRDVDRIYKGTVERYGKTLYEFENAYGDKFYYDGDCSWRHINGLS